MIRVAIADNRAMVRVGLRRFFADPVDFQVASEAAHGREAPDIMHQGGVDAIVLDISTPDRSGAAARCIPTTSVQATCGLIAPMRVAARSCPR